MHLVSRASLHSKDEQNGMIRFLIATLLSEHQDDETCQECPRPQPADTGVTFIVGAQTRLLPLPPDAGNISSQSVPVALDILPSVVNAAASRGHVFSVVHLRPLLTEHRDFVSYKWHRATVNLQLTIISQKLLIFLIYLPGETVGNQKDPNI